MDTPYEQLKHDVMELDEASQMRLAEEIVESVAVKSGDNSVWIQEAELRYEAYKTGHIQSRLAADVIKDARARIKR